ncbi:unnamed protein product [Scheffersomyces stipitis CBS 6054]|uniref:Unnamed protein product n=1 Tax=Scheffersomyces stipitis (strain ATCC 58785 / CBS 6054 / NBRC 10063 / NRRL Y-11545) TaxID=322104 RepID=A3LQJ2_PICST|nr:unnamed protein product [Scheffersomyces stipitis CBS 6054]ABN64693.2 unnamed protein product [Scheffersomyces stipitis CBS 6054]KAG2736827.1 hypothetical protein G9P44_000917 [Scheffersomyces stipitis]
MFRVWEFGRITSRIVRGRSSVIVRYAHRNSVNKADVIEALFPRIINTRQQNRVPEYSNSTFIDFDELFEDKTSKVTDPYLVIEQNPYFKPTPKGDFIQDIHLGQAFLIYFSAQQQLLSKDKNYNLTNIVTSLKKNHDLKDEDLTFQFIGKLISSKSRKELIQAMEPFISTQDGDLIEILNSLTPAVDSNTIDDSYIFGNGQLDYELYNKSFNQRSFELPKFDKHFKFNPMLLTNEDRLFEFHDIVFGEPCLNSPEISGILANLRTFGKAAFEFNSFLMSYSIPEFSERTFQDILIESLFNRIVTSTGPSVLLKKAIISDSQFCQDVVFQYLGVLIYKNGKFPVEWLHNLRTITLQDNFETRKRYFKLPKVDMAFLPTKKFPRLPLVVNAEDIKASQNDFENMGQDYLCMLITRGILINNSSVVPQTYIQRISNFINDSNPNVDCNGMSVFGYMVYQDTKRAELFIGKFFHNPKFEMSEEVQHYCKTLAFKTGIPLPVIRNNDVGKVHIYSSVKVSCPPINSSVLNRFLSMPGCVIQPSKKSSDGPIRWEHHPEIKEVLHQHDVFGELSYKWLINYFLYKHKIDNRKKFKHLDYSDLYQKIVMLLWSPEFKRFVIEDSNFYYNQMLFGTGRVVSSLITKRAHKSLPHSMFNQYVANLSEEARKVWVKGLVSSFLDIIQNLDEDTLRHLFKEIRFYLRKQEFSLFELNKERAVQKVSEWKEVRSLKRYITSEVSKCKLEGYSDIYLAQAGKFYLETIISKFNMNSRLEVFSNLNNEAMDITISLFGGNFTTDLGKLLINGHRLDRMVVDVLFCISSKLPHGPFKVESIRELNFKENTSIQPNRKVKLASLDVSTLVLPKLERTNNFNKLMSINFAYSRAFLDGLKCNDPELSELISKASTVAQAYFKTRVAKKLAVTNLPAEILDYLENDILEDKKLMMVINDVSNFVLHPFEDELHQQFSTMLYNQSITNITLEMRFHKQQFYQYLASLYYTERSSLDSWVDTFIDSIIQRLESATNIRKQESVLENIKTELALYQSVNELGKTAT